MRFSLKCRKLMDYLGSAVSYLIGLLHLWLKNMWLHSNPTQVSTVFVACNQFSVDWMNAWHSSHSLNVFKHRCAHGLCDLLPFNNESQMKWIPSQSYRSIYFAPTDLPICPYIYIWSIRGGTQTLKCGHATHLRSLRVGRQNNRFLTEIRT